MARSRQLALCVMLAAAFILLDAPAAQAYIGPGAGFALAGSFFAMFAAIFSAIMMILLWPFRLLLRTIFRKRPPAKARVKKVVVLGLDGLDFGLTEKLIAEGKLPHLASLKAKGSLQPLGSTLPPISPVAWSSFQTGTNPGKHNIFDFLTPDLKTYQPKLSSVEIRTARRRYGIGKFGFTISRPDVRLLRKSRPFWSVLSDYGIFNCIIRVPITFPAEKLKGVQLSAMCVPDLRGTQGTFAHYTTLPPAAGEKTGGEVHVVRVENNQVQANLYGPPNPKHKDHAPLETPFVVSIQKNGEAVLKLDGKRITLKPGVYSDWVQVKFKMGWGAAASGVCRFLLISTAPHFELYVTPINIDPETPAMPIGYPSVYPIYLAKKQGPYATLGLAEDTWGLSEEVLSDDQFVQQCTDIDREREQMFVDGLDKVKEGLCVCVFDGTDRMQHMFWRYLDEKHPARPAEVPAAHRNAIEKLYQRMDDLVGRTLARCQSPDTMLFVISDHGFNTFRRGIDLNRWLEQEGYLVVDDAQRDVPHLGGVDWSRTRAFAIGLTGIFINLKGKFSQGIVEPQAAEALRAEIAAKLGQVLDPQGNSPAIKRVYQAVQVYRGPYKEQAPDLIVGYERGYRVSWEAAIGKTSKQLFHDNKKAWSGDHCVDPSVVPGVLFCSQPIQSEKARLLDLGPTILDLFGIPTPDYMDGKALEVGVRNQDSGFSHKLH